WDRKFPTSFLRLPSLPVNPGRAEKLLSQSASGRGLLVRLANLDASGFRLRSVLASLSTTRRFAGRRWASAEPIWEAAQPRPSRGGQMPWGMVPDLLGKEIEGVLEGPERLAVLERPGQELPPASRFGGTSYFLSFKCQPSECFRSLSPLPLLADLIDPLD